MIATCLLMACSSQLLAGEVEWQSLESSHFIIHHAASMRNLAETTATIAETVHGKLTEKFHWTPKEKTHLVLSDTSDQANGYAQPFPFNRSVLYLSPPVTDIASALLDYNNWLESLLTHEYTHIIHLDKSTGLPGSLQNVFGRMPLLFPNMLNTPWVIEGLATYTETDNIAGIGRGQSTFYDMLIRGELANGLKPLAQINLPISSWPAGRTRYLYGVFFMRFIADRYGPEKISQLIDIYSDNIVPWRIPSTLQRVTGKDTDTLWSEFETWLRAKHPSPQTFHNDQQLTQNGYATQSLTSLADGRAFYVKDDYLQSPALMQINPQGGISELHRLHSGAQLDAHPEQGIAIVQPEHCHGEEADIFYDLYRYAYTDESLQRLTHCARLLQVSWRPDGQQLAAVRVQAGITQLVTVNTDGEITDVLWPGQDNVDLGTLDWSPDASQLIVAVHRNKQWNLELFSIADRQWTQLTADDVIELQPKFTTNNEGVLFSSEQSGSYQIHYLSLKTAQQNILTATEYGAFNPSLTDDNNLLYIGYSPTGFDVYKTALHNSFVSKTETEVSETSLPESSQHTFQVAEVNNSPAKTGQEYPASTDYSPWSSLVPRWWLPHFFYSQETTELGAMTGGNDALDRHRYSVSAAYDISHHYPLGHFYYGYSDHFQIQAHSQNLLSFNDDNELQRARREDAITLALLYPYHRIDSLWLGYFANNQIRETETFTATGVAEHQDTKDVVNGIGIFFSNAAKRLRAISAGDGRSVHAVIENSDAGESDYAGNIYTLDWREYWQFGDGQQVLAVRLLKAWGDENPRPFELDGPQAESGLSEFLSPAGEVLVNKRRYVLRGYSEKQSGRRMHLASAEWRFPISTIERGFMSPPIGLLNIHGSAFIESGAAWDQGSQPDQNSAAAGLEIYANTNWFYALPLQIRLGFAHGYARNGEDQIYLSAGSSF